MKAFTSLPHSREADQELPWLRYVHSQSSWCGDALPPQKAWATLLAVGDDGYRAMARHMDELTTKVIKCVESIPEVELLTRPDCAIIPIVATKSSGLNVYLIASVLEKKGWNMFTGQNPPVLGICVGEQHLRVIDQLVSFLL